jgi:hypothetical protein
MGEERGEEAERVACEDLLRFWWNERRKKASGAFACRNATIAAIAE